MLDRLRANPQLTAGTLPGADAWVSRLVGVPTVLAPDQPFLDQVVPIMGGLTIPTITPWDPYGEGYDDGPGDLSDCWHTDQHASTGSYCGTTVEEFGDRRTIFDELGAIVACLTTSQEDQAEEFLRLAAETWVPPQSQAEREQQLVRRIWDSWQQLSPTAKATLLQRLTV